MFDNTKINNNTAIKGGGIYSGGTDYSFGMGRKISNLFIYSNTAEYGGGIYLNELDNTNKNINFEVEQLARFNKHRLPFNPIKRFTIKTVCDVFRMDWCDTIMGLGKKI